MKRLLFPVTLAAALLTFVFAKAWMCEYRNRWG